MSRPLRIEYEGAWYHVMNRGAGRRPIFLHDDHRRLFLNLLGEATERFQIEIHAYCLMDNHYHLMIHTPLGNLSLAIRHINGLYTQRFNRMEKTDGSLLRGRYKALLVDIDAYAMQLSRYIHRNPLEAGMVGKLESFPWSSYRGYLGKKRAVPEWLHTDLVLAYFDSSTYRYQSWVNSGLDQETRAFYAKRRMSPILGSESFIQASLAKITKRRFRQTADYRRIQARYNTDKVIQAASQITGQPISDLISAKRPYGDAAFSRNLAMYACQRWTQSSLEELRAMFKLGHSSSVSSAISQIRNRLDEKPIKAIIAELEKALMNE